jgi:threonine dehydrogenase-like Zn-dependent dehydrogenase
MRVRVAQRATVPTASDGAWAPFTGDVLTSEPHCSMTEGDRVAGFGPPGAEIVLPWWAVVPVPTGSAFRETALLPLAELAARTADVVRAGAGDAASVIGCGMFARLIEAALRCAGLEKVTVASAPGADLASVVVDTTGDPAVVLSVFDRVPRRGRVVLVGASGGRTADVDFYRTVHQRGLEVTGVDDFGLLSAIGTDQDRAGARRSA